MLLLHQAYDSEGLSVFCGRERHRALLIGDFLSLRSDHVIITLLFDVEVDRPVILVLLLT